MGKIGNAGRAVLFVNILKKNTAQSASLIKSELENMGYEAEIFSFNGNTDHQRVASLDFPINKNSF